MKEFCGNGSTDPRMLYLDIRERDEWSASRPGRPTSGERSSGTPWIGGLGGPQSRSGRGGEEKNSQPLPRFEVPVIQPVVWRYTTELSRHLIVCVYV
jgi:hypothetical protein